MTASIVVLMSDVLTMPLDVGSQDLLKVKQEASVGNVGAVGSAALEGASI